MLPRARTQRFLGSCCRTKLLLLTLPKAESQRLQGSHCRTPLPWNHRAATSLQLIKMHHILWLSQYQTDKSYSKRRRVICYSKHGGVCCKPVWVGCSIKFQGKQENSPHRHQASCSLEPWSNETCSSKAGASCCIVAITLSLLSKKHQVQITPGLLYT